MIAIACYHKDDDPDSLYQLGKTRLGKIVEIMFLDAIGHKANWSESNKLTKEWAKEHYPQYQSFLPSKQICYLAKRKTDRTIDNCWTRTHGNDGYPQYRYSPIIIEDGIYSDYCPIISTNGAEGKNIIFLLSSIIIGDLLLILTSLLVIFTLSFKQEPKNLHRRLCHYLPE